MSPSDNSTGVIDRFRSFVERENKPCKHERGDISLDEEESIWHLEDSYLQGEPYWFEHDAAFVELRVRAKELRCFGCGETRTIETGELTGDVRWKVDMDVDELAQMREEVDGGSYFNGRLWWEDVVWNGDPGEVATPFDWSMDIGYQAWKNRSVHSATEHGGVSENGE